MRTKKKLPQPEVKKFFIIGILFAVVLIPLACSDNNTAPRNPAAPIAGATSTPTGTVSTSTTPTGTLPTSTFTPTLTPTGAISPTFTPTMAWTFRPTPVYDNNYGTSAGPNGMYYDGSATIFVAEAETKAGTIVNALEQYVNNGSGVLSYNNMGNQMVVGQATPCALYQPTPVIYALTNVNFPIGIAVSSPTGPVPFGANSYPGEIEILDLQTGSGSGATLYVNNNYKTCPPAEDGGPFMNVTSGFGGAPFNNPKYLTADFAGHFYVADTGNGYVDEFDGGGAFCTPLCSPAWLHRWNGPGSGYPSPTFKQPIAVSCDSNNNVYVADAGPFVSGGVTTSLVQIYTSGGTSIIGSFYLIPGCVANGLAVDSNGDFFVSDKNNGEVEEYNVIGWACCSAPAPTVFSQVGLVRAWGDPHSYHEAQPFTPSCLQFIGAGYIIVGDTGNDFLNVFGPLL